MGTEKNTLLVRHLPGELDTNEQVDLLKHFGASMVRYMGRKGRLRHCAFAVFEDHEAAKKALGRLHQLEVLGCTLSVEFSKKQFIKHHPKVSETFPPLKEEEEGKEKDLKEADEEHNAKQRLHTTINGIAPKLGLDYSMSPKLQYAYPPPNVSILTNIANALASVPKFYVQVLHLMNKMNLPAPFGMVTATPSLPSGVVAPPVFEPDNIVEEEMDVSSTEESEIESDGEDGVKSLPERISRKRPAKDPNRPRKKHKLQKIISAPKTDTTAAPLKPSEVFEQPQAAIQKKMEFKITEVLAGANEGGTNQVAPPMIPPPLPPVDILDVVKDSVVEEGGGFGKIEPVAAPKEKDLDDEEEEQFGDGEFISSRQLRKGRISTSEMKELSVYKKYQAGDPSPRLYIKNIAKPVTEKDLHYIYGRYVKWDSEEEKNMFDIRLMKEGRMKGQAFITLPSEQAAKEALRSTHGYELEGKPLVVQYARSAKPKENTDTKEKTKK